MGPKLNRVLPIAEKRTPGKWERKPEESDRDYIRIRGTSLGGKFKVCNVIGGEFDIEKREARENALFIASCAGAAEAGWRSTIAVIDGWTKEGNSVATKTLAAILAAWPEELL